MLLEKGADPNHVAEDGTMALQWAVIKADSHAFKTESFLLKYGANFNKVNNNDDGFLHIALKYQCWGSRMDFLQFALKNGADINSTNKDMETPLQLCLVDGEGYLYEVPFLIKNGANMARNSMSSEGPLHLAIKIQTLSTVKLILEKSVSIENDTTHDGCTYLHYALKYFICPREIPIIKALLDQKVKVNVHNGKGKTALHIGQQED